MSRGPTRRVQRLAADARRHGVPARGPDINLGRAEAVLQPDPDSEGGYAIRIGLGEIRTIGIELAEQIDAERDLNGPYQDLADLAERDRLSTPQAEALATAGACDSFGVGRRSALWAAGVMASVRPTHIPGLAVGLDAPALPGMSEAELTVADIWATGVSSTATPSSTYAPASIGSTRSRSTSSALLVAGRRGIRSSGLRGSWSEGWSPTGNAPATAKGVTFINLEDETGSLNVMCSPGLWARYRTAALGSSALQIRGRLERSPEGVLNLVADRLQKLPLTVEVRSRDFR